MNDCLGSIRDRDFDAVIGVGGIGSEARAEGIARQVNWIGIGPHKFYERLRQAPATPTTSQPTPADFLAVYDGLAGYERIFSLHIAGKLSGTYESARRAAGELGGDRIRAIDTETASAAIAMLGLAIQRRLERGTSDDEIDELVERYRREARLLFTSRRSSTWPAAGGSGGRAPGRASSCTSSRSSRSRAARSCR